MGVELSVQTTIVCGIEEIGLVNRGLKVPDISPIALNAEELAESFHVDTSFFEGYPHYYELSYNYFVTVDEQGDVIELAFLVAANAFIKKQVEECIKNLKFKPAVKDNQPVLSYTIVSFKFNLVPKKVILPS